MNSVLAFFKYRKCWTNIWICSFVFANIYATLRIPEKYDNCAFRHVDISYNNFNDTSVQPSCDRDNL